MIIPDINLLIFAHNDEACQHSAARAWWDACLNSSIPIGLTWVVIKGFLRIVTHSRILAKPIPVNTAIAHVKNWLEQPPVCIIQPGEKFEFLFLSYLEQLGTGGNITTDAYLAALAVEYNAELYSNDADFARFLNLRWKNPLVS